MLRRMPPRRQLTLVVLACAAGAGVALVAIGRSWLVQVSERPDPLPDQLVELSGGELQSWLPALGWVALAGAGALLATRGGLRRGLGGLLAASGVGIVAGAAATLLGEPVSAGWPGLTIAGGLLVGVAGVAAAKSSGDWPAMGARYERPTAATPRPGDPAGVEDAVRDQPPLPHEQLWDALDQGKDPTTR